MTPDATGPAALLHDVMLGTNDLPRAVAFWGPVMALFGQPALTGLGPGWAGWGRPLGSGFALLLCPPFDGRPATAGNGTMLTFAARDAAQVRAFHAAALAHGGADEGGPGTRPHYAPTFYVAYVRCPDGHKIACAYPAYDPASDLP